jgi:hypothetical protein
MDGFMILFIVIMIIGFILLVGSFVFLCIGKVFGGSGDNNRIEFQGWGLRFSTNIPLVFSLFLGALLIAYPFYEFRKYKQGNETDPKIVTVTCKIPGYQGSEVLTVYAAITNGFISNGEVTLPVPVVPRGTYTFIGFKGDKGDPFARRKITLSGSEREYTFDMNAPAEAPTEADKNPQVARTAANAASYQAKPSPTGDR